MSSGAKAWMVFIGTSVFFGIALIGPGLSTAGDYAVRTALDGQAGAGRLKAEKNRKYAKDKAFGIAQACCAQCALTWDYAADRCAMTSQVGTECVASCGAAGPKPVAEKAAH